MFSSHRQLIRTPNQTRSRTTPNINDRQISKDLEFTPIGRPSTVTSTNNSSFPSLQTSQATKATTRGSPVSRKVPVLHNHHAGSSFLLDELGLKKDGNDSPLRSEFEGADILADISDDDFFPTTNNNNNVKHTDFLDGSSNRIKEQLNELEMFQKENLNLRIEVQALRKSMPIDKLTLMSENLDLVKENQKLTNIIESQKENLTTVKNASAGFVSPTKYQNEINAYRAKLENSDNLIEDLKHDLQNLTEEKDELSDMVHSLEMDLRSSESRIGNDNDEKDRKIEDLEIQLRQSDSQCNELTDQINELTEQLKDSEHELAELDDKLKDFKLQNDELRGQLAKSNDRSGDHSNATQDELDDTKAHLRRIEDERDQLAVKADDFQIHINDLENERDELSSKLNDLQIHISELQNDREPLLNKIDHLEATIKNLENELDAQQEQLVNTSRQSVNRNHSNIRLTNELNDALDTIKKIQNPSDDLDKQHQLQVNTSSQSISGNYSISRLQTQLNEALDKLDDFKSLLNSKDDSLDELQSQFDNLKIQLNDKDHQLNNINDELEDRDDELQKLTNKYNHLKQALHNLQDLEKQKSRITSDKNDNISSLRQAILDTQRDNESLYINNQQLSSQNKKLADELDTMKENNSELKQMNKNIGLKMSQIQRKTIDVVDKDDRYLTRIENENRDLQNTISSLDTQIHKLQKQLKVQDSDLAVKEDELTRLKQVQSREKANLLKQLHAKDDEIIELESKLRRSKSNSNVAADDTLTTELEGIYAELRKEKKLHLEQLTKLDEEHASEIEEANKQISNLEKKNSELIEEYEILSYHYKELETKYDEINESYSTKLDELTNDYNIKLDELNAASNEKTTSQIDEFEFGALADDLKKLTIAHKEALSDQSYQRQLHERVIQRLNDEIYEKNKRIELLESKANSMSQNQYLTDSDKSKIQMIKDERDSLISEKLELNRELNNVTFENDELRRKVDQLVKESQTASKLSEDSDGFYHELQSKRLEMNELRFKLETVTSERDDLVKSIKNLKNEVQNNVIDQTKDANNNLKKLSRSVDANIVELSSKLRTKELDLAKLANDYNDMKNDLLRRIEKLRSEKMKLTEQITELNNSLEKTRILYDGVQSQLTEQHDIIKSQRDQLSEAQDTIRNQRAASKEVAYPLSPKSPINSPNSSFNNSIYDNTIDENEANIRLLQSQKELYRFKLQQYKNLNADLRYGNKYLSLQLQITERKLRANEDILNDTEDYGQSSRRRAGSRKSLRAAILCVMAVNRFKYRLNELNDRKEEEELLKRQIGKIRREMNSR